MSLDKNFDPTRQYYKVTNERECHRGFQYRDGLNVLIEPFQEKGSCVPGGLYFSDIHCIHEFYDHGIYLREVTLPVDDPEFKVVRDKIAWRTNKIILGRKYSLFDPNTYITIGPKLGFSSYVIDTASKNGDIATLNQWKHSGLKLRYSIDAIDFASANGHTLVLDWWKSLGLQLKYSSDAIDDASMNGHVAVLEWWKSSELKLKYSNSAIDYAFAHDRDAVLDWWVNSGLKIKCSHHFAERLRNRVVLNQ